MQPYQRRLRVEYYELNDRIEKLQALLDKRLTGELDFELNCPVTILQQQLAIMIQYRRILLERDTYEHVGLEE